MRLDLIHISQEKKKRKAQVLMISHPREPGRDILQDKILSNQNRGD